MGSGAVGAAVAAGALTGCDLTDSPVDGGMAEDTASITSGAKYSPYENPDKIGIIQEAQSEEEVAAVFVGTGIGGMMGAMICAEQMPDAKIVLLEKNGYVGGNTNFAERNAPKPGTDWETALKEGMETAKASSFVKDGRLYAERAYDYGKNSAWMYLKHHLVLSKRGGFTDMYEGGSGAASIKRLEDEIKAGGVYANLDLRLETRATALLLDDDYTCTGVQVRNPDGTYSNIYANAVVLVPGGMSNNLDLLQYYTGQDVSKCESLGFGQDGDGNLMVEQTAHGRTKTITLSSMYTQVGGFAMDSLLSIAASMNSTALFVNEEGERFVDESSMSDVTRCKVIEWQGKVFSIIGTGLLAHYENGGMNRMKAAVGIERANEVWDASKELETYKDEENMFMADTLEELADKIGVPIDAFTKTVGQYEADCISGNGDSVFGKEAEYMVPQGEGPYYAFRLSSVILNTNNGIRVNHNAQVVDPHYTPVEGLYAAGIAITGFNSEVYSVATSQSSSVWGASKAARHLIMNRCEKQVSDDWFGDEVYTKESVVEYDDFVLPGSSNDA